MSLYGNQFGTIPERGHGPEGHTGLLAGARRSPVHHQHPVPVHDDQVGAGAPAHDHVQQIGLQAERPDVAPDAIRRQIEQRPRAVVDDGHVPGRADAENALTDAVQERLAMIGKAGDLRRLESVGLLLDPPREEP